MLSRKILLSNVSNPNPSAGQVSVIGCPAGERVLGVLVKVTAATATALPTSGWVGDIVVKLGGKPQRVHSASELNKLNLVNGSAYGAVTQGVSGTNYGQIIPIFFQEPWRNNNNEAQYLGVETSNAKDMQIEVNIASAPAGGGTITVAGSAIVDRDTQRRANPADPFVMKKVYRTDYGTATNLDIPTLDRRDIYSALHIAASNITKAVLKADGLPVHELTLAENDALLTVNQMDATQFDYSMVMDQDDSLGNGLFAAQLRNLELRIEQSGSSTVRVLAERIGAPD